MSSRMYESGMYYGTAPEEEEPEICLDSTDDELELYIEQRRKEFYEEWFLYVEEDDRGVSLFGLSC